VIKHENFGFFFFMNAVHRYSERYALTICRRAYSVQLSERKSSREISVSDNKLNNNKFRTNKQKNKRNKNKKKNKNKP